MSKVRSILHCFYLPGILPYSLYFTGDEGRRDTRCYEYIPNTKLAIRWIYKCNWHSFTVWNPLFALRIYYTNLFLYKHATLNANSDATLNFFFFCFWVSNIRNNTGLPSGCNNRHFEFLLRYLWGWEGRKYYKEN